MTWTAIAILALVTLQRLVELRLSERNTRELLANGAKERGAGHYPFIVAMHAAWLVSLWWFAPGRPIDVALLILFALLQLGRLWVLRTLGPRWTTRIITVPGERLVKTGPYRWFNHPNYAIVTVEIALLPMVFGLWQIAVLFSLLNAAVLMVRIRAENRALGR